MEEERLFPPVTTEFRVLSLVAAGAMLSALSTLFGARTLEPYAPRVIGGLPPALHPVLVLVGIVLFSLLAFVLPPKPLALTAVLTVAAGFGVRAFAATYSVDFVGITLETAGLIGWFAVLVVTIWRHLPRERLLRAPFTSGATYAVFHFSLAGIGRGLIAFATYGFVAIAVGYLALLGAIWTLLSTESEQEAGVVRNPDPERRHILFRLAMFAVGTGSAQAMLWRLVHTAPPFRVPVPSTVEGWWRQSLIFMVPSILLLGMFLWRSPERLGPLLRVVGFGLLVTMLVARLAPETREMAYLLGHGTGMFLAAVPAYLGLSTIPPTLRLPFVAGLALLHSGTFEMLASAYVLSHQRDNLLLAVVVIALLLVLVLPTRRAAFSRRPDESSDPGPA